MSGFGWIAGLFAGGQGRRRRHGVVGGGIDEEAAGAVVGLHEIPPPPTMDVRFWRRYHATLVANMASSMSLGGISNDPLQPRSGDRM